MIHEDTLAVQGSGWLIPEFEDRWNDKQQREALLQMVQWIEKEPVALGMNPHLIAVARKGEL